MVNATKKWIFLKASSIILIPLMLWFIINLVSIYEKDYIYIVSFFSTQPSKFLTSLLMIVAFFYSSLSISEIFEDYIHDEKIKNIANKTVYLLSIIILVEIPLILSLFLLINNPIKNTFTMVSKIFKCIIFKDF